MNDGQYSTTHHITETNCTDSEPLLSSHDNLSCMTTNVKAFVPSQIYEFCECQEWLNHTVQINTIAFCASKFMQIQTNLEERPCLVVLVVTTRGRTLHTVKNVLV